MSRTFEGSGTRVRRVLEKALRGEPVGVGIIGASVTVGHGLAPGVTRWWEQFQGDFQKMFPKSTFHNGAVSGMNSGFFSSCFGSTLPTDLDLYITELDINNEHADITFTEDDDLIRGLLDLPQAPAVMRVSVFTVIFREMTRGYTSTLVMSHWHDIPVIGLKDWLLPHVMRHPESLPEFFGIDAWGKTDYRHVGPQSHRALGDMLSIYMREQACEVRRRIAKPSLSLPKAGTVWPPTAELGKVPTKHTWDNVGVHLIFEIDLSCLKADRPFTLRLFQFFKQPPIPPKSPSCQLANTPKTPLIPIHTTGNWTEVKWHGKAALVADKPGSRAMFQFSGTQVGVYLWVTGKKEYGAGAAYCWVDEDKGKGKFLESWQSRDADGPLLFSVAKKLAWGVHTLSCEIASATATGGHEWRLIGIASL
ncbi:hypothetical protein P7C70_g6918, partial [Phenoliferia sp. Uapishka_3]